MRELLRGLSHGRLGRPADPRPTATSTSARCSGRSDDWLVIDFEGEPARPLPERRLKQSPLRDVAGMLRSFSYAARRWPGSTRTTVESERPGRFLDGYMRPRRSPPLMPPLRESQDRLLRIFELEKAVYELRYELAHRPDWVRVPVAAHPPPARGSRP